MNNETITTLGSGRFLNLRRRGTWEFVQRSNAKTAVVIIATTDNNEIVLVEQRRPAMTDIGPDTVIELPAGLVGDEGNSNESILVAADRELVEETGYKAGVLEALVSNPVCPALCDEVITFVRATNLQKIGSGGGVDGENITVHIVPLTEIRTWLSKQKSWIDPKVYSGLYLLS